MGSHEGLFVAALAVAAISCTGGSGAGNGLRASDTSSELMADGGAMGIGSTGHNGLAPSVYQAHKVELNTLMGAPLPAPAGAKGVFDAILADPSPGAGALLLQYTLGCALTATDSLSRGGLTFKGEELLRNTGRWLPRGDGAGSAGMALGDQSRDDLHTCIVTRLNPYGANVTIWLGGPDVTDTPGTNPDLFPHEEALWLVHQTAPSEWTIDVWPSEFLQWQCGNQIQDAIKKRACGTAAGALVCGVRVRYDRASACQSSDPYRWSCDATEPAPVPPVLRPAIKTKLDDSAYTNLYPGCRALTP